VLSDEADLVVVNTCAFIADACSESIETILEEAKKAGGGKRLVVTGCLVERYGDELPGLLPEVDAFLSRDSWGNVEKLTERRRNGPKRSMAGRAPAATFLRERSSHRRPPRISRSRMGVIIAAATAPSPRSGAS